MMQTISAAGHTILRLVLNLSFMEHPCVLVAAMVVSDMNERLSPKNDPPTMIAVMNAGSQTNPVAPPSCSCIAIPDAIGANATMVPTLVPMDMEMKQDARNSPAKINLLGRIAVARFTVASMAPICLAVDANAPAITNIHIIIRILLLPAPLEKDSILFSKGVPLLMMIAYTDAIRKAEATGMA